MTTISSPPRSAPASSASLLDVEALLGYRPVASVALYLRRRRRPPAALRVDLPAGNARDAEELARALTGLVARVPAAVSAEIVVYGRESDDRPSMRGNAPLVRVIRSRLVAAGFEVPRVLFVVRGHWADAQIEGGADPWRRLPVGSSGRGGAPAEIAAHPPDLHHGPFVPIAPASEHRRARAMAALGVLMNALPADAPDGGAHPDSGGGGGGGGGAEELSEVDVVETLLRWNAVLTAGPGSPLPSDARAVALLWSIRHRVVRDCVLMLCAWGFDAGVITLHEATEPEDATVGGQAVHDTVLGVGTRPPDAAGLRSAIELLRHLVSCAPESITAPALTMLAWLEWARGRGLAADSYLEACRRADPDYRLARLLQVMIQHGFVPEWIGVDAGPTLCRSR
ncbi:DUF4192 domain-containing protein [Herbiconiux sp. CPCC 205763]|uniref:DUF4192 domain-containing protein n=1 Tax=Herbiconiux aconitum TaxID=2970913 RepID=A0ABT2GY89_9MICO|nr:DUF4192 domain-containing protein [Herbiconiux aconitum]MCS5719899.1 DUF4192 domain-containing protein [Herbiconiux aconitum]